MKVTLNDNQSQQKKEIKYPLLAKNVNSGTIAYFITEYSAVILDEGDSSCFNADDLVGVTDNQWEILPKGVTIILEND